MAFSRAIFLNTNVAERDEPVGVLLRHIEDILVGLGQIDLGTHDREQHAFLDVGFVPAGEHLFRSAEWHDKATGHRSTVRMCVDVNEHHNSP